MKPMRVIIALIVLAVLGAAGGWWYFARNETPSAPTTVQVERGNLEQTVLATGALEAQSVTSVGAQVSGTIQSLPVKLGDNATFTITPNTGYKVKDVLVDGSSVGTVTSYTFTNITANHTIAATFDVQAFTITPSAGAGGSATRSK